ncbi:MAG: hypothetical protein V4727_00460 [Verrucomicrobiota bacterium]
MKFTFVSACLVISAHADVLTPVQSFFGLGGQPVGEEYEDLQREYQGEDYAPFSAADSDLGVQEILAPTSDRVPVMLDFATAAFYTDNAPMAVGPNMESSWLWYSRLMGAWRPHLAHGWHADVGATQELLWFDRAGTLDYENSLLRLGVVKSFADLDDLVVFARYEYQRLTTGSLTDGDYHAQRLRVGVQKILWETALQSIAAGIDTGYEITARPDTLERNQYAIELAHRYRFSSSLSSLVTWRSEYYDYSRLGREDWAQRLGLELIWELSQVTRVNASVFFDNNDSNSPFGANDHQAWTAGLGVGFTYDF